MFQHVEKCIDKKLPVVRFLYWLSFLGNLNFDLLAKFIGKKFSVSTVRVKKFCAITQFDATKAHNYNFKALFTMAEGLHQALKYEFMNSNKDNVTFISE